MLFALSILLAQVLAIQASFFSKPGDDAKALCAGENIDLVTYEQLEQLEATVPHIVGCPVNIEAAVEELLALIKDGRKDLCSAASLDKFKSFYFKFMNTSTDKKYALPESLQNFAIAYGMKVSNLCKKNAIEVLSQETSRELLQARSADDESQPQIQMLTTDEGPVAKLLGSVAGPDEIFAPGDLASILSKQSGPSNKLFIQAGTSSYIRSLQAVCHDRFRPTYGPLIMPLAQLANMGFNYKEEPLKCSATQCSRVARELGQWSRIMFMCESLANVHIVEENGAQDGSLVRILTEAEAEAIESARHGEVTSEQDDETSIAPVAPSQSAPVHFGSLVYDKDDKKLVDAVKSFKTNRSEQENLRRRLMSEGYSVLLRELKSGHFKLLISTGYKSLLQRVKNSGSEQTKPREELVKMLDELSTRGNKDLAPVDSAVSINGDTFSFLFWVVVIIAAFALISVFAFMCGG